VQVRITDVPPGEAPDWVRRAWVGMVLPLAPGETGPRTPRTVGVLSGPRDFVMILLFFLFGRRNRETGYVVEGRVAVQLLAEKDAEAARWWQEKAPHVLRPGHRLVFQAEVCQEEW
jgi:hypothetical protein